MLTGGLRPSTLALFLMVAAVSACGWNFYDLAGDWCWKGEACLGKKHYLLRVEDPDRLELWQETGPAEGTYELRFRGRLNGNRILGIYWPFPICQEVHGYTVLGQIEDNGETIRLKISRPAPLRIHRDCSVEDWGEARGFSRPWELILDRR